MSIPIILQKTAPVIFLISAVKNNCPVKSTKRYLTVYPVATCQGRIYHFPLFFPVLPCFPYSKSWRMTRLNLSSTLWVLLSEKCTSLLAKNRVYRFPFLYTLTLLPYLILIDMIDLCQLHNLGFNLL